MEISKEEKNLMKDIKKAYEKQDILTLARVHKI